MIAPVRNMRYNKSVKFCIIGQGGAYFMRFKAMAMAVLMLLSTILFTACDFGSDTDEEVTRKMSYMIYYGALNDSIIENA